MIPTEWLGVCIIAVTAIAVIIHGRREHARIEAEAEERCFAGLGESLMRIGREQRVAAGSETCGAPTTPSGAKGGKAARASLKARVMPAGSRGLEDAEPRWAGVPGAVAPPLDAEVTSGSAPSRSPIVSFLVVHADGSVVRYLPEREAVKSSPGDQ